MQPEAIAQFIKAFGEETNARNGLATADRSRLQAKRTIVSHKLDGFYDAIAEGLRTPGLISKLEELEAKLVQIDEELSAPAPSTVRLHPNLSDLYRRKVTELAVALADPEIRTQALETIRGLIETATVHMSPSEIKLELKGALSAMVGLAQGDKTKNLQSRERSLRSVEVVARTGFGLSRILGRVNVKDAPCLRTSEPTVFR